MSGRSGRAFCPKGWKVSPSGENRKAGKALWPSLLCRALYCPICPDLPTSISCVNTYFKVAIYKYISARWLCNYVQTKKILHLTINLTEKRPTNLPEIFFSFFPTGLPKREENREMVQAAEIIEQASIDHRQSEILNHELSKNILTNVLTACTYMLGNGPSIRYILCFTYL